MSDLTPPDSPAFKGFRRGVRIVPAPAGSVRLVGVDSRGNELLNFVMPLECYGPAVRELMHEMLDQLDPPGRRLRLLGAEPPPL